MSKYFVRVPMFKSTINCARNSSHHVNYCEMKRQCNQGNTIASTHNVKHNRVIVKQFIHHLYQIT